MDISIIIKKLSRLKVARYKGSSAPHKAILLLSIFQSIETGEISENKIFITPELVARFKDNWHSLVHTDKFNPNFSLPFFHLKSDGFFHLKTFPGKEILLTSSNSIRSFSSLKEAVAYAFFDEDFFVFLTDGQNRALVEHILLTTYLNGQQLNNRGYDLFHEMENQILTEPTITYKNETTIVDEETAFVRGGVFKKTVPRVYNYTCCISGMRIIAARDIQMIDACHIRPVSESGEDNIRNGISLSPNFHRAFDRFLITINEHYEVIVSENFTESGMHLLKEFHGKKIHLPQELKYYPSIENLIWHQERFSQLS